MDAFNLHWSFWSSILFVSTQLLEYGLCIPCYTYDCKSSIPTKCRLFARWSADTTECNGTCYDVRNTSKSFVYVSRGCTGQSTSGCRPVIKYDGGKSGEYYHYEACFCDEPLCNGGHGSRGFHIPLLAVVTGQLVVASVKAEILSVQNLLL